MEKLSFVNTSRKIAYTKGKTIFYDKDGSLSGTNQVRWITKSHPHLVNSDCSVQTGTEYDDSTICSKPIMKLLFHTPIPKGELQGMQLKVV